MTTLGAATELLQHFAGRDASWSDLLGDFIGACVPIALTIRPRSLPRYLLVATLGAAACVPLAWTLTAYAYRHQQLPLLWRSDSTLLNHFAHWQEGDYPGLVIDEVPPDWRGYGELLVTVNNAHNASNFIIVRVDDVHHNQQYEDRFNRQLQVPPRSTQTFSIPLEEIRNSLVGRSMDIQAITGVAVFQLRNPAQQRVSILSIALNR